MLKLLYRIIEMNTMGVTGLFQPPQTDFCRQTDIPTSHEISIEQPSVRLALLAQSSNEITQ